MNPKQPKIELQWRRLLGFDQIRQHRESASSQLKDARLAKVGAKCTVVGLSTGE